MRLVSNLNSGVSSTAATSTRGKAQAPGDFSEGFPVHTSRKFQQNSNLTRRSAGAGRVLSALCALLLPGMLHAQAPAVVATSPLTLNAAFTSGPAVTDACGDVYVFESGGGTGVVEYQAGTGKLITIAANAQGYLPGPGRAALYMDQAKKNLYFPDFSNYYTAHFTQVPIVNCAAGAANNTFGGNTGSLPSPNYYYGTVNEVTGDAAGDVFFTTTQSAQTTIFGETFVPASNTYTVFTALTSWPNQINYLASDAAGNIYFADQTTSYPLNGSNFSVSNNIYLLKVGYKAAPTLFASGFNNVVGLSFDPTGNLYVADSGATPTPGNSVLYEIPTSGSGPVAANRFALAATGLQFKVAVDALRNVVLSGGSGLVQLKPSSAVAPATAIGAAATTFPVNYVFNATVTPTSITAVSGTATSTTFAPGTGCKTGTAYTATTPTSPAATSTCSLAATFTPSAAGQQTGAILFTSSAGTVATSLAGIGLAPQISIDPGVVVPVSTALKSPAGITVDNVGNVFVVDSSANTLTEYVSGKGVGTTISTGTLTLKSPMGVAVDNIGDIFIADTGNNRIVEIPVVNGVLTPASAIALAPVLKAPQGVATDGQGNLYIADTGNNNLLFIPNASGTLNFAAATSNGTALSSPTAVTVDLNGNVFLAEAGANNDVLEFVAPFGTAAQIKVATSLSNPTALATDASGALFITNTGTSSIVRLPKLNGTFGSQAIVGSTLAAPFGVATDSAGNLYATDTTNSVVAEVLRVQGAALQFGGWNVGTTSTPLTGNLSSSGTQPLIFGSPSYLVSGNTAAGFKVTNDTCAGQTLQPGSTCSITANFTPPITELNATENLTLQSNNSSGMAQLQLIGTGANVTPSTLSLTLTPTTGLSAGQSVTLVATVGTGTNPAIPGGSVKFFVNNVQVGTGNVANKQATLVLKNGLPGGATVTISASYSGDVINYSGSTASINQAVSFLGDTFTFATGQAYSNPASDVDNAASLTGPVITLTASLTPSTGIIPNGMVTFYSGTKILGMSSLTTTSATPGVYTAAVTTTSLRAGTTNLVENNSYLTTYSNLYAVYAADATYAAATSNTAAITIVGANPSANSANPNITGATFTITPTNPAISISSTGLNGQGTGSAVINFISYGGYQGVVNFTCTGLPAYAQCAPFPGAPIIVASTPAAPQPLANTTFIINTNVPPLVPTASSMILSLSAFLGVCLAFVRRRSSGLRATRLLTLAAALLLSVSAILGVSGCGSSSSSSSTITPAGTYNVTVAVHAAQLLTNGNTLPVDANVPNLQITLIVK